jgi:hypothetical protein
VKGVALPVAVGLAEVIEKPVALGPAVIAVVIWAVCV